MESMLKNLFIALICILCLKTYVQACVCGCDALGSSSTGFGGSIITTSAYTMPQNSFSLGSGIRFNNFEDFNIKQVNYIRNNGIHAHNRDSQMFNYLAASYGLTENLTMTAVYPYGYLYGLKSYDLGQIIDEENSIGFGDLTLQAKYKFVDFEKIKFASSIIAGIKMPTGQINERDSFGDLIPADHQPGSGSWDPIMGMAFTKIFGEKLSGSVNTSALWDDALRITVDAVKRAGSTDGDAIRLALESTSNFKGLISTYSFSKTKHDGFEAKDIAIAFATKVDKHIRRRIPSEN
jgi:hypothetical protein